MTYTVSSCFLENADIYDITGVLDELSNKVKEHRLAKDKNGEVIDIYKNIKSKYYYDLILNWLFKLTIHPESLIRIEVDLSHIDCIKEKFLTLCEKTADKILIVNSRDDYIKFDINGQKIIFNRSSIKVLNKKEARDELNRKDVTHIEVSGEGNQVAGHDIVDSSNKNNF